MYTITPRTRIQEGVSWEDEDCYETGYEICDDNGEIIYDFANEDIKDYYEYLNRQEEENTIKNRINISLYRNAFNICTADRLCRVRQHLLHRQRFGQRFSIGHKRERSVENDR